MTEADDSSVACSRSSSDNRGIRYLSSVTAVMSPPSLMWELATSHWVRKVHGVCWGARGYSISDYDAADFRG